MKDFRSTHDLVKQFVTRTNIDRSKLIIAKAILSGAFLESVVQLSVAGGELFKVLRHYTNSYFEKDPISSMETPVFTEEVSKELKRNTPEQEIKFVDSKKNEEQKIKEPKKVEKKPSKPKIEKKEPSKEVKPRPVSTKPAKEAKPLEQAKPKSKEPVARPSTSKPTPAEVG